MTSDESFGEATIGLALARRLRAVGDVVHFVIGERHRYLFQESGFPFTVFNRRIRPWFSTFMDRLIREFRPDIIVLADYLVWIDFSCPLPGYQSNDWSILKYGVPVIPIDIYEWANTDFEMDGAPGMAVGVSNWILKLPACIRPVPFCHPETDTEGAYPVTFADTPTDEIASDTVKAASRSKWGLSHSAKVVMLAIANWQMRPWLDKAARGNRLSSAVFELLLQYLVRLPKEVQVVWVGHAPVRVEETLSTRLHVVPECSTREFDELLTAADLFLTLNLTSTALARAIVSGTSCAVLVNSHTITDAGKLDDFLASIHQDRGAPTTRLMEQMLPIYPFVSWPLSYYKFTRPLFLNNPCLSVFVQAEILEIDSTMHRLAAALLDGASIQTLTEARAAYLRAIRLLSHPHDVMEYLAGKTYPIGQMGLNTS